MIIIAAGKEVQCCCATNIIAAGNETYEDRCYTCPLHQEQHYKPAPDATRHQELPGCRHELHTAQIHLQEERVALWIAPPHYLYTNGVMVTGHRGISVSCTPETAQSSHSQDNKAPKDDTLTSEESNECCLRRALPERRDEEGVEEMEVGKTYSGNVQQFTCQSSEVFMHLNTEFDLLILPHQTQ